MKLFSRTKKATPSHPKEIVAKKIEELQLLPHGISGGIDIGDNRFYFHDARCFYDSYLEIWKDEIYKFNPSSENPVIIDCGANMGVSVLFFAKEYPKARIIAFEPDAAIYDVLQKNIASFHLNHVELHK